MMREVRREGGGVPFTESGMQLTERAGVVDVDDEFSWG